MESDTPSPSLSKVIQVDEAQLRGQLSELVRDSVEETLNGMLDAEAEHLCNAKQYERTAQGVFLGTVSALNQRIYGTVET